VWIIRVCVCQEINTETWKTCCELSNGKCKYYVDHCRIFCVFDRKGKLTFCFLTKLLMRRLQSVVHMALTTAASSTTTSADAAPFGGHWRPKYAENHATDYPSSTALNEDRAEAPAFINSGNKNKKKEKPLKRFVFVLCYPRELLERSSLQWLR
jgi:hypothetical protein